MHLWKVQNGKSRCLESGVAVLRSPGWQRLIFNRGGGLRLGPLQPLGDVLRSVQSEIMAELTQGREWVRLVTLTGSWPREQTRHRHCAHRREVSGVRLVGGGDVQLGRMEVELMRVGWPHPRGGVAVGGVHWGHVLGGARVRPRPRDLQRGRRVWVRVSGRVVLGCLVLLAGECLLPRTSRGLRR